MSGQIPFVLYSFFDQIVPDHFASFRLYFISVSQLRLNGLLCYSVDIWCLSSDLITPNKETPNSAQQGMGSGDDNFPRGT